MNEKGSNIKSKLPSRHVSVGPKSAPHRSMYYAMGLTEEEIYQPFIGVANSYTDLIPGHVHLQNFGKIAKDVLEEMFESGKSPQEIVDEKDLKQVTDQGEIEIIIDDVIKDNSKMVDEYLGGKVKLLGFFVGQAMKKTKGKANPKLLNDILIKKLTKKN